MSNAKQEVCSFIEGQRDCKEGILHQAGKGKDYDRGYEYQYWCEQQQNERTRGHE